MSVLKSLAKFFATRFLTQDEIQELAPQTDIQIANTANSYLRKTAQLLSTASREYQQVLSSAESFILNHHKASSLSQMCRSYVRRNSKPDYYIMAVIGQQLEAHITSNGGYTTGGEAGQLLQSVNDDVAKALAETNVIKRRSIVRDAVKREVVGISADRAAVITELLLAKV